GLKGGRGGELSARMRGLLGVAVAPNFPLVPYVYLYYSVCKVQGSGTCALAENRVARVTAGFQGNADRADPASHLVLLDDTRLVGLPREPRGRVAAYPSGDLSRRGGGARRPRGGGARAGGHPPGGGRKGRAAAGGRRGAGAPPPPAPAPPPPGPHARPPPPPRG